MGICCGKKNETDLEDEEKLNDLEEIKLTRNSTILNDDPKNDNNDKNIPSDKLLINELKLKFPDGLEDLKRRFTRSSFRKSINTQNNNENNHLHGDLIDDLTILEDKLRGTQKLIVNNAELSMVNILEQFKFDLAAIETSLHPEVIDKRREVYCKLKTCFYLAEVKDDIEYRGVKKKSEMDKLQQRLIDIENFIDENNESQKELESVLDNLENLKTDDEEDASLKMFLKEKSIYLIKVCILKNYA